MAFSNSSPRFMETSLSLWGLMLRLADRPIVACWESTLAAQMDSWYPIVCVFILQRSAFHRVADLYFFPKGVYFLVKDYLF